MEEYIREMSDLKDITNKMDTFSTEAEEYYDFGDKEFIWDDLIKQSAS